MTQDDIDNLQPPSDGTPRNFEGLLENLHSYKIPPSEQYAIILKSNFGAIGNPLCGRDSATSVGVMEKSNCRGIIF